MQNFPQVLQAVSPIYGLPRGDHFRIVSDSVKIGDEFSFNTKSGKDIKSTTFRVSEIITQRPARGNWGG